MNIWLNLCMWEMNRYEILTKFKGCFRQETMTFKYQARSDWLTAAMTTFDLGPNLVPPRVNAHNQSQSQCQQEEQPERAQCEEPAREREGRGGRGIRTVGSGCTLEVKNFVMMTRLSCRGVSALDRALKHARRFWRCDLEDK